MARIRGIRPGSKPAWSHISPEQIRAALEPLLGAEFRFVLIAEHDEAGYTAGRGWSDPEETAEGMFRDAYEAHELAKAGLGYEDTHRVALARELCATAGVPLRDRYGWAASDETVLFIVGAVFANGDDAEASGAIGGANALGDIELAQNYDESASEEFELKVIAALRPLVAARNAAEKRAGLWLTRDAVLTQDEVRAVLLTSRGSHLCGVGGCQVITQDGRDGLERHRIAVHPYDPRPGSL